MESYHGQTELQTDVNRRCYYRYQLIENS